MKLRLLIVKLLCLTSSVSWGDIGFNGVTEDQFKDITKDLAANFSHRSVSGAASLGTVFGLEVNLFLASTSAKRLSDISKAQGGGSLPNLYSAGLMAGVSVPFGFTFEALFLPSLKQESVKFSGNSFGLRWLANELVPVLPINLALRFNLSNTDFGFSQNVGSVQGDVSSNTRVTEIGLYLSPKLPVLEPYLGFSAVSARGSLDFTGTGTFFNNSFTSGSSASVNVTGTKTVLGLSVLLPLFSFGLEYVSLFGTSGYGAKLGMSF